MLLVTEDVYDANAGLVLFMGDEDLAEAPPIPLAGVGAAGEEWVCSSARQSNRTHLSTQAQTFAPGTAQDALCAGQLFGTPLAGLQATSRATLRDVLVRHLH